AGQAADVAVDGRDGPIVDRHHDVAAGDEVEFARDRVVVPPLTRLQRVEREVDVLAGPDQPGTTRRRGDPLDVRVRQSEGPGDRLDRGPGGRSVRVHPEELVVLQALGRLRSEWDLAVLTLGVEQDR